MKNVLLLIILMVGSVVSSEAQTQKTLVKSINLAQTEQIIFNLPGEVTNRTWDNDFVRVTTYLTVDNMNDAIVKQLVLVGRYNLVTTLEEHTNRLVVTMPKINNHVRVKGVRLSEHLRFEVQAPMGYKVTIQTTESTTGTLTSDTGQTL